MTDAKMKKTKAFVLAYIKDLDDLYTLDGSNYRYWKKIFDKMDLKKFTSFMKDVRDGKTVIYGYTPHGKCPTQKSIYDMLKKHGIDIMHHIVLTDNTTGIEYITPEKYPVLRTMYRRLEQFAAKKIAISKGDRRVDSMTGQVLDRAAGITHPEMAGIGFKNLPLVSKELMVRGGNTAAYQGEFKQQLESEGMTKVGELDPGNVNRTVKTTEVLLRSMGFETDILDEGVL